MPSGFFFISEGKTGKYITPLDKPINPSNLIVASGKSKIHTFASGDKVYEIAYASAHGESPVVHQVIKG